MRLKQVPKEELQKEKEKEVEELSKVLLQCTAATNDLESELN